MFRILKNTLLILCTFYILAYATTMDNILNSFSLSLPDTSGMDNSYLHYDIDHQELLRESKNDTLLSRFSIRAQKAEFNYIDNKYSINAKWIHNVYSIADLFNTDYTLTSARPISHRFDIKAQTHVKEWVLQPGIHYAFSRMSDTLFVTDYPISEISAYNNYFFNLLPETFGDTIPFNNAFDAFHVELLGSKSKNDQGMMFYLKYSNTSNRLTESHKNTSSNNKLSGPRESLCKLTFSSIETLAGWQSDIHSFFWVGINYNFIPLDWEHTVFPSVPDTTEIVQLANSKTNSFNIQLGYKALSLPVTFQATLSTGFLANITEASTPVLGYILRILPISHQADLIASSTYLLTHIHVDYPLKTGNSTFLPRLDVIAARFWTDVSLEALLQFGLEDIDYVENYVHAAYIASIGCEARIALNRDLHLTFEADQLLPYIKTISPEPPTPIPSDIKRYGGLSISAGVSMSW